MDEFFTKQTCDQCHNSLDGGRIMSIFTSECICIMCSEKEKLDPDYEKAVKADHEEIKKGNYNFQGLRGGKGND